MTKFHMPLPMIYADEAKTLGLEAIPYYTADQMQAAFESGYEEEYVAGNQAATESRVTKFMDSYTRAWVGLTDEDVNRESAPIAQQMKLAFHAGMYVAQKILKEKNT